MDTNPIRRRATLLTSLALSTLVLAPLARPCVSPPLTSPGVCINTSSIMALQGDRFAVDIYVKGYELFGGSPGHFCGCALTLPPGGALCEVTSATVVFAGTNLPVPGFGNWQDTHEGAEAWGIVKTGNWYAFTAPVVLPLTSSIPVDVCFTLVGKLPHPPYGVDLRRSAFTGQFGIHPMTSLVAEVVDLVTQGLVGTSIGTDEANSLGEPIGGHQGLFELGTAMPEILMFESLAGGVAGSFGPLALHTQGNITTQGGGDALLESGLPNTLGILAFGFMEANTPYFGGTFVPSLDVTLPVATDATGHFAQAYPVLPAVAIGTDVYLQYWQPDPGAVQGIAGSNALHTMVLR